MAQPTPGVHRPAPGEILHVASAGGADPGMLVFVLSGPDSNGYSHGRVLVDEYRLNRRSGKHEVAFGYHHTHAVTLVATVEETPAVLKDMTKVIDEILAATEPQPPGAYDEMKMASRL